MLGYLNKLYDYLFGTHTHHDYKTAFKVSHLINNAYSLDISLEDIRKMSGSVPLSCYFGSDEMTHSYLHNETPYNTFGLAFAIPEKLLGYNNDNVIDHIHIENGYCHDDQTMIGRINVMEGFEARLALCVDNDALEHTGNHLWIEL
jgi:hypothetical protein